MILNENYSYSIKEASEVTKITGRTLTRLAVKLNKEKIDGRYLLEGFELIKYLNSKKIDFVNYNDLLKNNEALKTENRQLTDIVKELTEDVYLITGKLSVLEEKNTQLKTENGQLKTQRTLDLEILENENSELKTHLKEDVPHQEKLKSAIQLITLEAMEKGLSYKVFTDEEYQDLIGTISSVDFQTKQVEYLKGRVEKQDAVLKKLVDQTTQRNFIEAKEKGYDKD